jgi:hypothetical protein
LDDCGHRIPAINGWAIFKDDEAESGAPEWFAFRQCANVAPAFGHDALAWAKYQCQSHARIFKWTRMIPMFGKARQG